VHSVLTASQILKFNDIDENNLTSFETSSVSLWSKFVAYIEYLQINEKLGQDSSSEVIEKIELGLKIASKLKENYFFESSEIEFQKSVRDFIDWAIKVLSRDLSLSNNARCLELIFDCIEFDKSI